MRSIDGSITLIPWDESNLSLLSQVISSSYNSELGWTIYRKNTVEELMLLISTSHRSVGYHYAVSLHGDLVGFAGFTHRDDPRFGYTTSTYLDPACRGGEVNLAIKDLMIRAFSRCDTPLRASIEQNNLRSQRAMAKVISSYGHSGEAELIRDEEFNRDVHLFQYPHLIGDSPYWEKDIVDCVSQTFYELLVGIMLKTSPSPNPWSATSSR